MEPSQFDKLTKALVRATSRRHALKALGATIVGTILGVSSSVTAEAMCSNQEAVTCCKSIFPPGRDRDKCISDAANGSGPCTLCR